MCKLQKEVDSHRETASDLSRDLEKIQKETRALLEEGHMREQAAKRLKGQHAYVKKHYRHMKVDKHAINQHEVFEFEIGVGTLEALVALHLADANTQDKMSRRMKVELGDIISVLQEHNFSLQAMVEDARKIRVDLEPRIAIANTEGAILRDEKAHLVHQIKKSRCECAACGVASATRKHSLRVYRTCGAHQYIKE